MSDNDVLLQHRLLTDKLREAESVIAQLRNGHASGCPAIEVLENRGWRNCGCGWFEAGVRYRPVTR